jgi:tetratricopeptide (TPR) repeat protein
MTRLLIIASGLLATLTLAAHTAHADEVAAARMRYEKGLGAYALGHYAEAAQHYEAAFGLKPDPALLYDAAQAHRFAGNKERALLLYRHYLLLFSGQIANREEVQQYIASLKSEVTEDRGAGPPANDTAPALARDAQLLFEAAPRPAPASDTARAPLPATPPTVLLAPPPRPLAKRPWLWATVGASVVVAGVAIGLGVGLSRDVDPVATLGATVVR